MSIYGPSFCNTIHKEASSSDLTHYIDLQDSLRVLKTGDSMTGYLTLGGNLVRGLPTTDPPLYHGDEAVSWNQAVGLARDTVGNLTNPTEPAHAATKDYVNEKNSLHVLKTGDAMTGELRMGNHHIREVGEPSGPHDVATKRFVDSTAAQQGVSYHFKLRCGEESKSSIIYRDFFLPNLRSRFGRNINKLYMTSTVPHASGYPTSCTLERLSLDEQMLRLRFSLLAPWEGRLNIHARIDVLPADTRIEHHNHVTADDGSLLEEEWVVVSQLNPADVMYTIIDSP